MSLDHKDRWHKKLIEQYLNTFFRETRVDIEQHAVATNDLPAQIVTNEYLRCFWFSFDFRGSGTTLIGRVDHLSLTGYHQYGPDIYLQKADTQTLVLFSDIDVLLSLIATEVALSVGAGSNPHEAAKALLAKMQNSVEKSGFFLEHRTRDLNHASVIDDFIAAEQGMILGHPFHVTSKASSGFSQDDIKRFSPELGVSFQLHYFAVLPELMETISSGAHVEELIDPIAKRQASELLNRPTSSYQLIPCHPWQADYLRNKSAVKNEIAQSTIVPLGAIGETVWPTSSVRTVWMPNCRQFLKLSLDVRITNFIRNNPEDQRQRAIDISRVLNQLSPEDIDPSIELLPENIAQTVRLPGLSASFGIVYRAGLSRAAQVGTRILGSLVEECPESGKLPLFSYIERAAQSENQKVTEDFIAYWWRRYVSVALVSTLKLFADHGISLEAHLQNSLMHFKDGFPVRLVVRDMEGASLTRQSKAARRCPDISPDSPVWYSTDACWFRFQYYVVVNHISHIIAAIARQGIATEQQLWHVAGDVLAKADLSSAAQGFAKQLRELRTLPAKANLLSTFNLCSETPSWVEIANPLAFDRTTSLTPLVDQEPGMCFQRAESRVVAQLLEALLFERVLAFSSSDGTVSIPISETVRYRCTAVHNSSFDRVRIRPGSLQRIEKDRICIPSIQDVLRDVCSTLDTASGRWPIFEQELMETWAKHAQSVQRVLSKPLRDLDYFEQEARVNNGHLYHPGFKARTGFTLGDNAEYGPELSFGFSVIWIAVKRHLVEITLGHSINLESLYSQHFSALEQNALQKQIGDQWGDPSDYVLLPVHPWQWKHTIELYYQLFIATGDIMRLDVAGSRYLPQQSVRTLSNLNDVRLPSLKLAINMGNTSTSRVLAPHTVHNCAPISDWLSRIVAEDTLLPDTQKPVILKEFVGMSVTPSASISVQYGALACIWRESIYRYLTQQQSATPVTALTQVDVDGEPVIALWVKKHGIKAWLSALIVNAFQPVLHMLWHHGIALEAHAQNMVLIHEDGLPVKVALKDFHDGIRYARKWLKQPDLLPELTEAPEAHKRINPNSFLETDSADELRDFTFDALGFVNLAELAWFLHVHFDFEEAEFWNIAANCIREYQICHPELAERFALFDVFDDHVQVEQLASRRFLPEKRLRVMSAVNPLAVALYGNQSNVRERLQ